MKLHALEIPFAVTDPHNLTAGAAGSDVKLGRERRRVNHQRVIAGHRQGIIQPLKHPFAVMLDKRGLPCITWAARTIVAPNAWAIA